MRGEDKVYAKKGARPNDGFLWKGAIGGRKAPAWIRAFQWLKKKKTGFGKLRLIQNFRHRSFYGPCQCIQKKKNRHFETTDQGHAQFFQEIPKDVSGTAFARL